MALSSSAGTCKNEDSRPITGSGPGFPLMYISFSQAEKRPTHRIAAIAASLDEIFMYAVSCQARMRLLPKVAPRAAVIVGVKVILGTRNLVATNLYTRGCQHGFG